LSAALERRKLLGYEKYKRPRHWALTKPDAVPFSLFYDTKHAS